MSGSEIALFSLSRFQIRELKEHFRPAYRKIKKLLGDPGGLLITILVTNELVNISLSTLIAEAISESWRDDRRGGLRSLTGWILPGVPDWIAQALIGTLITAPIVLFLCEITPKV